jgi:hypothetical protein
MEDADVIDHILRPALTNKPLAIAALTSKRALCIASQDVLTWLAQISAGFASSR